MSRFQNILKQPHPTELAVVEHAKVPANTLSTIHNTSEEAFKQFEKNPQRYQELVANPKAAKTKEEKVGIMAAREILFVIDESGSMSGEDTDPRLTNEEVKKGGWFGAGSWGSNTSGQQSSALTHQQQRWTLWNSACVATESVMELSLAMDRDHKVDVMLFPSTKMSGSGGFDILETNTIADVQALFRNNSPCGSTPLAAALLHLRRQKMDRLLTEGIPFTCIVMTDGVPDNQDEVYRFFVDLVRDHRLNEKGREYLAAFSFVQMGDDSSAKRFLESLDDNMEQYYRKAGVNHVDIIDTKEDNFLFGTGKYSGQAWKGPFALLHDAIFD